MNITEFLEARIKEDDVKATLRTVHAEDCGWIPDEAGYSYPCDCGIPERMKAECAAKRAIIVYSPPKTLQHLAAVYKGHPDYQQEWAL